DRQALCRRGGQVGVDVGGFDPGVLDPGDSAPAVIVGGAFERPQANGFFLGWANGVDEIDRSPFAQSAQRRAVLPTGDLADLGFGGLSCDAGEFESAGIAPDGVIIPGPQHHGAVGDGLVQPAGVEESTGDETAVIGGSGDPLLVRVGCGVAADL